MTPRHYNVVVPFSDDAEAAFSFLNNLREQGWFGVVVCDETGEQVEEPDFGAKDND